MHLKLSVGFALIAACLAAPWSGQPEGFEGYIRAVNIRGGPSMPLLYTLGANFQGLPGGALMPARPEMPPIAPASMLELRETGHATNLLGYTCQGYEIRRHGEAMEIWATDKLWPFPGYLVIQPHRKGPPGTASPTRRICRKAIPAQESRAML